MSDKETYHPDLQPGGGFKTSQGWEEELVYLGNAVTWIDWKHVRGVKRSFWLRFIWPIGDRPYFFGFKRYWKIPFWPKRRRITMTRAEQDFREMFMAEQRSLPFYGGAGVWDKDTMLTPTKPE